jgi:hypothetical protein
MTTEDAADDGSGKPPTAGKALEVQLEATSTTSSSSGVVLRIQQVADFDGADMTMRTCGKGWRLHMSDHSLSVP